MTYRLLMGCFIAFLSCVGLHEARGASEEHLIVAGRHDVRVATYQDIARIYERFERFPQAAKEGLSLHFTGELLPDHDYPSKARLMVHSRDGDIPLFFGQDRDMHFPLTDRLKAENPPVLQTEAIGHNVRTELSLVVALPAPQTFTGIEARHWLRQVNACIRDLTGVILSWFMPDAHRLKIDIAPGANFEAVTSGSVRVLASNVTKEPMIVLLRPQDYAEDTVFRSSKPFGRVRVKIPGEAYATFTPDR